jgi:hypothetical protein
MLRMDTGQPGFGRDIPVFLPGAPVRHILVYQLPSLFLIYIDFALYCFIKSNFLIKQNWMIAKKIQ